MAEKTKVRKPRPQGQPGESTDGQRWAFETRTPDLLGSEVKRLQEQQGWRQVEARADSAVRPRLGSRGAPGTQRMAVRKWPS